MSYSSHKKSANVVIRDVVHRVYKGVLYFQTVVRFYGTLMSINCIYWHKEITENPAQLFMKHTNTRKKLRAVFMMIFIHFGK